MDKPKFPGVLRFPRHKESYKLKLRKAEQLATLKAKVWERIRVGQDLAERGRKANIEIGRALNELKNELKSRVGHGHWEDFYVENFGSSGIAERTARTWMKMARREPNAISKTADSAVLPRPMAPNAEAICDANEKTEAKAKEDYDRERGKLQLDGMFKKLTRASGLDRISLLVHHCGSVPVHHTHQSLPLKMQLSESSGGNLRL